MSASGSVDRTSLRNRAARGVAWYYAGSGAVLVSQVAYTAVTARLLSPRDFGAYAVAQALSAFLGYFALSTVGQAVLRREDTASSLVRTAFTVSVAAAGAIILITFAVAPIWASLWKSASATGVVRVLAVSPFFLAAAAVPLALLRKDLRYRDAAAIESLGPILGMFGGIVAAITLRDAYALAVGQVVGSAFVLAAALALTRRHLSFGISRTEARYVLSFAAQVSGQNFVYFLIYTSPAWVISRAFGSATLGQYSRADLMVGLPFTHLYSGITKSLYPIYTKLRGDIGATSSLLTHTLILTTGATWPFFAAVAGSTSVVVAVLLGPGWGTASALLPALCLTAAARLPNVILLNAAENLRWLRIIWAVQASWATALMTALAVSVVAGASVVGIAYVVAGCQLVVTGAVILTFGARRYLNTQALIRSSPRTFLLTAMAYALAAATERTTSRDGLAMRVIAQGLVLAAVGAILVVLQRRWLREHRAHVFAEHVHG